MTLPHGSRLYDLTTHVSCIRTPAGIEGFTTQQAAALLSLFPTSVPSLYPLIALSLCSASTVFFPTQAPRRLGGRKDHGSPVGFDALC